MTAPRHREDDGVGLDAIDAALRSLAPSAIRTGVRRVDERDEALLFDVERAGIRHAVSKRRSEFASGRALLRQLVDRDLAIPVGANGAPILPDGFAGSLAHDESFAVAAVSCDRRLAAIGVDVEPVGEVDTGFSELVLRFDDDTSDPLLAFVLKEAVYKAWSRPGRPLLEHHDVRLAFVGSKRFTATIEPAGELFEGRFRVVDRRWIALVVASQ